MAEKIELWKALDGSIHNDMQSALAADGEYVLAVAFSNDPITNYTDCVQWVQKHMFEAQFFS